MKVRITTPGEYDRHESEVRFRIKLGDATPSVSVTEYALYVACDALGAARSEPLVAYAVAGRMLEAVLADVVDTSGDAQPTYLITHVDILRITGHEPGMPHVPKRWNPGR